jgi:type IV pilus assembly protein PilF
MIKLLQPAVLILLLISCVNNNDGNNKKLAKLNASMALAYLHKHDVITAKEKLLQALAQDAKSFEANSAMACFLDETGEVVLASEYYKKSIIYATSKGAALNNYAVFLCKNHNYNLAKRYFLMAGNDASYHKPAQAFENLGLCALMHNDVSTAKKYFAKAIKIDGRTYEKRQIPKIMLQNGSNHEI